MPDGTIIWTSPTGHTYTTYPGRKHLFRNCANPRRPCGPAIHQLSSPPATGVMMPKRRHTRATNTARAIAAERKLNDAYVAERNKPPPF